METYVVRVWRAADDGPGFPEASPAQLRGLVEHVGTGTTARFGGGEELLRFLRRPPQRRDSQELGQETPSGGQ